jgi:hypothetical protein
VSVATERLVYEESVRTVTQQRELLDGLRARAGTVLAAASVSTAFLSAPALAQHQTIDVIRGRAITHPSITGLGWVAVALFCLVVILAVVILVPWRWTFVHHPHRLIAVHLEPGPPSTEVELFRNLAYWNGAHYDSNGWKLDAMLALFAAACLLLLTEIVIWLLILSGT